MLTRRRSGVSSNIPSLKKLDVLCKALDLSCLSAMVLTLLSIRFSGHLDSSGNGLWLLKLLDVSWIIRAIPPTYLSILFDTLWETSHTEKC
ncbi:hypothetical protein Tco_1508887 [Tanacetum coccineum]